VIVIVVLEDLKMSTATTATATKAIGTVTNTQIGRAGVKVNAN
jgi:hypothetical protein